jgi:hypothetical protein
LGVVRCNICAERLIIFFFKWSVVGPQIILETSVPGCQVTTSKNQSVDDCGPDSFVLIRFQVVPQVASTATPAHYLTPITGVALAWEAQYVH